MVEPLKSKTMTLKELQRAALKFAKQVRKQLRKAHWQGGMTDKEFSEKVVGDFIVNIKCDIEVEKMKGGG